MPSDIHSKGVDKGVDRLKYKILDIIDLKTGEPKRNDFYHCYVGQICRLSKDIDKCIGKSVIIHRLTGDMEGPVAIRTSYIEKIVPNEAESVYGLITQNTCYVLQELSREIKNGNIVDKLGNELKWE